MIVKSTASISDIDTRSVYVSSRSCDHYPGGLEAWGTDTGITFNRNIESWRFNRKYFDYAVTNPAYLYGTIERMQEYFKEMQGYWKELGSDCVLDLNAWIYHIASDIIFFNTTGRKFHFMAKYFNVLSTGKKIDIEDSHITEKIFKGFENAFKAIFFLITTHSLLRHTIYRKQNKEHLKAQDQLRRLLCELIQERRKEIENTPVDEPLKPDIMNLLITANTERDISHNTNDYLNRPLTDDAIQMSLFESIAASTSTSVAAFIFVVEYVGRHPEVEAKIRTEINSFFSDNPNRVVTYGNLNEFKYIEAVYYETTRINTAVPFMFRTNQREDVIAGYRWKPDTQFVVNYQAPHRNEKHFTDPEKFIPERFINDGSDEKGTFKKAFYPWGGGLHICPARNIGLAYVKMLLVLLYRNYEVKLVNADKPIQTYHDFITQCADTRAYLKPI
ncbi:3717_t:CDS:2 [Ambispora gerdemannii]|uniref:3717_t:CDS:1 n=1 Tax=Ambispora gerdemannii TaxID=144530 RepID=A0A9N9C0B6_9GLOM|nr:3717_t:CDS:2 [Ambispora gerdemannii]